VDPGEELVAESRREPLGLVQTRQQQAAEQFPDGGSVQRRQRQELTFGSEDAVGNDGVEMRVEIGPIGTVV